MESSVKCATSRMCVNKGAYAKRLTDILVVTATLPISLIMIAIVTFILRITSSEPVFYVSKRIGADGKQFLMPKFRTMRADTPDLPPYQLENYSHCLTPIGAILRKSSLDEIPQIWCILNGKMSLVGPRPAGINEPGLIASRSSRGIDRLMPGLTGWAQINGRNSISVQEKVQYDKEYLERQSWLLDLKILVLTLPRVLKATDIRI